MSDAHEQHKGGHELESVNSRLLFKLVFGLTAITLAACLVVVQWAYSQRDDLLVRRADEGYSILGTHQAEMEKLTKGIRRTLKDLAKEPTLLEAGDPPEGWIHPDDIAKK